MMFLAVNIAEFLKTLATNCSEGLAWLLGIVGTIGTGTIIGAIITIIKSKIQSKSLINSVNSANKENYNYLLSMLKEFEEKINSSNNDTKETVSNYGKDNAIISELLLMLSSKMGFSNDEIIKIANKYKELPKADNTIATNIVNQVNEDNKNIEYNRILKEQEEIKQKEENKTKVEGLETALNSLKADDVNNLSSEDKTGLNGLKISL